MNNTQLWRALGRNFGISIVLFGALLGLLYIAELVFPSLSLLKWHDPSWVVGIPASVIGVAYILTVRDPHNYTGFYAGIVDIMQTVVDGCGETCHFGILSGGDVLYLAKVNSPQAIRMYSMTGRRLPAYSTAIGKALLRDYTPAQLKALYPEGLKALTPNTITDLGILYSQLLEIRAEGFAYEVEESNENIR